MEEKASKATPNLGPSLSSTTGMLTTKPEGKLRNSAIKETVNSLSSTEGEKEKHQYEKKKKNLTGEKTSVATD